MQGCGIFYEDDKMIRFLTIREYGELLASGLILNEFYKSEEDVKKLFEYIWLDIVARPEKINSIRGFKGKNIKFLSFEDVDDFIRNRDMELGSLYYFKNNEWYYMDNQIIHGGWELLKDEVIDIQKKMEFEIKFKGY